MQLKFGVDEKGDPIMKEMPLRWPSRGVRKAIRTVDRKRNLALADLQERYPLPMSVAKMKEEDRTAEINADLTRQSSALNDERNDLFEECAFELAQAIIHTDKLSPEDAALVMQPVGEAFWLDQDPVEVAESVRGFRDTIKE
jgi:hypothetical protein